MDQDHVFYCSTSEGYVIKSLSELLQNTIKNGCFLINNSGISFRQLDSNEQILIDFKLEAQYFNQFKFLRPTPLSIGINLSHFHKLLRNIKKRDSVSLFIDSKNDSELGIRIIPKDKGHVTTSYLKIQNLRSLEISIPDGYTNPAINIACGDYIKMLKDINILGGDTITISSSPNTSFMSFKCNANDIFIREITFGDGDKDILQSQEFDTESLMRIQKIMSLGTQLQIYQDKNKPLFFRSNISILGKICVYIKDKHEGNKNDDNSDSEYDSD